MANKFSFYIPSSSNFGAETHKEFEKPSSKDVETVDGDTVGVEASFSASTFEDGSIVANTYECSIPTRMTYSSDETAEEDVFDEREDMVNDDEAFEEERSSVVEETASEETEGASQKYAVDKEEGIAQEGREEGPAEDNAYESGEEGSAKTSQLSCSVPQSHSYMSEVTFEGDARSTTAASCSIASNKSSDDAHIHAISLPPATQPASSTAMTLRLTSMMNQRIRTMDKIRNLLRNEQEQEEDLRAQFTKKVKALENESISMDGNISDLTITNANHVRKLESLSETINQLLDSNRDNVSQISKLERDAAAKANTIKVMNEDVRDKQSKLEKRFDENLALEQHLKIFKAENEALKDFMEDIQSKNVEFTNELETLMTSLRELTEQNAALEIQAEELVAANEGFETALISTKQKNTELLDTVDDLTESLNTINSRHNKKVKEIRKEIKVSRRGMKEERDVNAVTIQRLERHLEDATAQMKNHLSAEKETFENRVSALTKALDDAKKSCKRKSDTSEKLHEKIEEVGRAAAKSTDAASGTIGQLEKDLEEEFRITTKLKRGMEDLKKRAQVEEEDERTSDELEELLESLREMQCWQLSHFQRISKLVSENKDHLRSIHLVNR